MAINDFSKAKRGDEFSFEFENKRDIENARQEVERITGLKLFIKYKVAEWVLIGGTYHSYSNPVDGDGYEDPGIRYWPSKGHYILAGFFE